MVFWFGECIVPKKLWMQHKVNLMKGPELRQQLLINSLQLQMRLRTTFLLPLPRSLAQLTPPGLVSWLLRRCNGRLNNATTTQTQTLYTERIQVLQAFQSAWKANFAPCRDKDIRWFEKHKRWWVFTQCHRRCSNFAGKCLTCLESHAKFAWQCRLELNMLIPLQTRWWGKKTSPQKVKWNQHLDASGASTGQRKARFQILTCGLFCTMLSIQRTRVEIQRVMFKGSHENCSFFDFFLFSYLMWARLGDNPDFQ